MKISPKQFRERYNIPLSTESKLKADGVVPFEKIGRFIVYDQSVTDELARQKKLGTNAFIAISNLQDEDAVEEHY